MDWQETRDARRDFELRLGRVLGCRIHLGARLRQPDAPRPGLSPGEAAGPGKPEDEGLTAGGAREKGGPR
jgi:hypothetical protein